MKELYTTLASRLLNNSDFVEDYRKLFTIYILNLVGDEADEISKKTAIRLTRVAQILVSSRNPEYIQIGVRIIDMFLELTPSYLEDLLIIAEEIFSNLGNFPNVSLIDYRWSDRPRLYRSFSSEMSSAMHRSINEIEELNIDGTNFQVDLWNSLEEGLDIVTIAPTSTGKSFLIIQHVVHTMLKNPEQVKYAAYVVPSRALIHEVSKKIQKILSGNHNGNIEVATIGQRERTYRKNTIFVVTQERLLMLLHFQPLMSFSYVVVDEAQNIAGDSRGVLLHIAISQILERGNLQLVFSTPSEDYKNSFKSLLGEAHSLLHTDQSPVAKNIIEVRCSGRNLILKSKSPAVEVSIPKKFSGTKIDDIVYRLGRKRSSIVYANTKSDCENLARSLSDLVEEEKSDLADAEDYIRNTIHKDFTLASAISKGVAFHYGPLPRNIRIMIENHVENNYIDFLICTSTLAEGVNLPAKNLFISDPKIRRYQKPSTAMPKVQYKNIVGRAGRLMTHFSGNVFLINFDTWKHPECASEEIEAELPTYFRLLKDNLEDVLRHIKGESPSIELDQQSLNAAINKTIQDVERGTFESKSRDYIGDAERQQITNAIEDLLDGIDVPAAILALNPSIGILQQSRLFSYLSQYEDLLSLEPMHPKNQGFFDHIKTLITILYEFDMLQIPELRWEGFSDKLSAITVSWARGVPLKQIIEDSIHYRTSSQPLKIDTEVRNTVRIIDNDIRFKLATSVKCFTQLFTLCALQNEIETDHMIEIYSYLEVGASDQLILRLISLGLCRQTSIEISDKMKDLDFGEGDSLNQILKHPLYESLHKITRQEIESLIN